MYSYEQVLEKSLEYFGGESLPANIFATKYALQDNEQNYLELTPDDMHWRIARELARVEKKKFKKPMMADEIYEYLKYFQRIIPQGSPMFGIGNNFQYISLSNCFVVDSPEDSYGGICRTDEHIVQISKRRGGIGYSIDNLRPEGLPTKNSSRTTTGGISFMHRFSHAGREVGQNGRRAAQMITCGVHYPDIEKFATIKNDEISVTGANISVRLSDEFLKAVEEKTDYEQRWPNKNPVFIKMVDAASVWKTIIHSAWLRAEPGLLFWDTIIRESPADCYAKFGFETIATNPCSELPLSANDSCRLLLLNLLYYVVNPFTPNTYFDYELFRKDCGVAQRFMDDIVDLEIECINKIIEKILSDPEPDYVKATELQLWQDVREACISGRRTGTGITALADTLAALGIKYDSEEGINTVEKIYETLKFGCYESSVNMAEEIGAFPCWDYNLEKNNPFLNRFKDKEPELYKKMKKFGRRNIACLTTAPCGTTSLLCSFMLNMIRYFGTTSGIEPLFKISYLRNKKINPSDKGARVDFTDELGDKWQTYPVYHTIVKAYLDNGGDSENIPWVEADSINWETRVKLQARATKHVDHSISSTVNLPNDVTEEEVAKIYETAWKEGCFPKGHSILTEFGVKDISQIKKGLHVIDKDGKFSLVTDIFERYEDKELIQLQITGLEDITCTQKHPIFVVELLDNESHLDWQSRSKRIILKNADEIKINDHVITPLNIEHNSVISRIETVNYINSKYIIDKDGVFLARKLPWAKDKIVKAANSNPIPYLIDIDEDLAYLIGWYLAEGSKSGSSYIRFDLNKNELNIAKKLQQIIKLKFNLNSYIEETNNGTGIRLQVGNKLLQELMVNLCGSKSREKHLPKWWNKIDKKLLTIIITEHWNGDKGVTFSHQLAKELFVANLSISNTPYFKNNYGEGWLIDSKTREINTFGKIFQNYKCYRIRNIKKVPFSGLVYNFAVDKSDTYTVNGAIVHNCKGITVYRDGCRSGVLITKRIKKTNAPKRPVELPCKVYNISVQKNPYIVIVGLMDGEPYEVISYPAEEKVNATEGRVRKIKRGHYQLVLNDEVLIDSITEHCLPEHEAITRLISSALRHGTDIGFIVQQLEKTTGGMETFTKALARALKKHIPENFKVTGDKCSQCGSEALVRQEGCLRCLNCGSGKCG